ncbi:MAG: hypothetical protein AAB462_04365 [Patescibacteria group bacterium]
MSANGNLLVAKFGTESNVISGQISNAGYPDTEAINGYCKQLSQLSSQYELAVVISGAATVGASIVESSMQGAVSKYSRRSLATIGNPMLFAAWQQSFNNHGKVAGQVIVSHAEMEDKKEGPKLVEAYADMRASGVIPLFNENDVLETREMEELDKGGDNDGLAAHIATRLGANRLLLLTASADGFKVDDIVQQTVWSADIPDLAKHDYGVSNGGSGGIIPKLEAAATAVIDSSAGLKAYIGNAAANYEQILAGQVGTEVVQ